MRRGGRGEGRRKGVKEERKERGEQEQEKGVGMKECIGRGGGMGACACLKGTLATQLHTTDRSNSNIHFSVILKMKGLINLLNPTDTFW